MSNETGEASFNMSLQSLKRVDALLWKISTAALNKDYETWNIALRHLRRESAPYLKPKVFDAITSTFDKLDKLNWLILDDAGRKIVETSKEEEVNKLLDELTIEIQRALYDSGILMARTEDRGLSVVTT
jgi:hypothetical protein